MIYSVLGIATLYALVAGLLSEWPAGPWVRRHIGHKVRPWLAMFWPLLPLFVIYAVGRRLGR